MDVFMSRVIVLNLIHKTKMNTRECMSDPKKCSRQTPSSVPCIAVPPACGGKGGLSELPAPALLHHTVPGCRASGGSAGQLCCT